MEDKNKLVQTAALLGPHTWWAGRPLSSESSTSLCEMQDPNISEKPFHTCSKIQQGNGQRKEECVFIEMLL